MQFDLFVTWVLVGLIAGCLARLVMKGGGCGLITDLLLGLAGSIVGSAIFQALALSPEVGRPAMSGVAFVGAISMIVAQRLWYRSG